MEQIGIYIHIPFCKQKCYYCDFISFSNKDEMIEKYIKSLEKEIEYKLKNRQFEISTIYIGGGTPSSINEIYIKDILNKIKEFCDIKNNCEITIEVNPGTVNENKLKLYEQIGINRISIGLQSTSDRILKEIGRIHTYEDFIQVYNMAREVGLNNINIDLMLGLPNQAIKNLENSVEEVIKLNPEHISIYSLILEENTVLEKKIDEGELKLPNEDIEREMYWSIKEKLEQAGYIHYEISNFSKEGYNSKHNMNCWNQKEYLGFGIASHSYLDNIRFSNIDKLEEYIKNIEQDKFEKNIIINEKQNIEEKQKEFMLLGLRKIEGISVKEFKNKFIQNPIYKYHKELEKLAKDELIEIDGDYIKLTNKGLDLANIVWEQFV